MCVNTADFNQNATKGVEANCYARMAQKRQNAKKVSVMVQDTVNTKNSNGNVQHAKVLHCVITIAIDIVVLTARALGFASILEGKHDALNAVTLQRHSVHMDVNDASASHAEESWFAK